MVAAERFCSVLQATHQAPSSSSLVRIGRLIETTPTGEVFEIGRITVWEPGVRLAFNWRQEELRSGSAH
jgi:hypothetical protein